VPSSQLVTRTRDLISVGGWRQVRDVYDRLSMTPRPSRTARDRAAARGSSHPWRGTKARSTIPALRPSRAIRPMRRSILSRLLVRLPALQAEAAGIPRCNQPGMSGWPWHASSLTGALRTERSPTSWGVSDRTVLRLRQRHEIPTGRHGTSRTPVTSSVDYPSSAPNDPTGSNRLRGSTQLERSSSTTGGRHLAVGRAMGV